MEICGCIHLHTKFSDGGADYDTLIKAAEGAGLDYICVTDHMTLEGKNREGFYGPLFVLVGYEHNDENNRNHYIAFGTPETAGSLTDPQEYINRVKEMGGIGFLSHPAEKRRHINETFRSYPWTAWNAQGFDGIEIWNQLSDWMEQLRGWRAVTKLLRPNRLIRNAPQDLLHKWDEMNRNRFVSAIGVADAHSGKFSFGPFGYLTKYELRGIRTHFFVDQADWSDEKKTGGALIAAMRDGKGFISNYCTGDAKGCKIILRDNSDNVEYPGVPTNNLKLPMMMEVSLTEKAEIRLIRNGEVVQSATNTAAEWTITETGVYRVEAYKQNRAWIYSNPFPVGRYPL